MNADFLPIINKVNGCLPGQNRDTIVAAALATYISKRLPLPSSALECSPNHYYLEQVGDIADRMIGNFNEHILIPVKLTQAMTREFWMNRYQTLHSKVDGFHPTSNNKDYFSAYSDRYRFISDSRRQFLDENLDKISQLIRVFNEYLGEFDSNKNTFIIERE